MDFSHITDIEVAPTDADEVWISLSNYNSDTKVIDSTDGGTQWTNLSGWTATCSCQLHRAGCEGNGLHYVGTDVGVYRLHSGGRSLEPPCPQACPMSW